MADKKPEAPLLKYIVVQRTADNNLKVLATSDNIQIAALEHLNNNKPGFPQVFILKLVAYHYNFEEVQND